MAEDKTSSTEATTVKRRLRTAPETMRERTEKLQNQKDKDQNAGPSVVRTFGWGFLWPIRKLIIAIASLGRFKFFRGVGLVIVPRYLRNSWKELRLVTWPNARQSYRLTYAVLIFSVLFGVVVAVLDFGLDKLFKAFVIK